MSTTEQITPVQELAQHAVHKSSWDKWVCICGGWEHRDDNFGDTLTAKTRELHAAHVVPALTNAGKTIVDHAKFDELREKVQAWCPHLAFSGHAVGDERCGECGLAAARVAEGGERRG